MRRRIRQRDYWTIYDDESMDFEQELENQDTGDTDFNRILESVLKRYQERKDTDHFEKESDLFEV